MAEPKFTEEELKSIELEHNDPESEYYLPPGEKGKTLLDDIKDLMPMDFFKWLVNTREHGTYSEGGDVKDQTKKAMSYGQLIVDNIIGLDNDYESLGEKLGKAINKDEVGFLKGAATGIYEGAKEFVTSPIDTTKEAFQQVKQSVKDLGGKDLEARLQDLHGVTSQEATADQINSAKESVLEDAMVTLGLIPAAKGVTTGIKAGVAAIPSGVKADAVGQTKALLSGDTEFLKGTPTEKSTTQGVGAEVTGSLPAVTEAVKNTVDKGSDNYVYVIHGGATFEGLPDFNNPLRTGESRGGTGLNPLGNGMYGFVVDATNVKKAVSSVSFAQHYAKKYGGTSTAPGQLHLFKVKRKDFNSALLKGEALNKARQRGLQGTDGYYDRQGKDVRSVSYENLQGTLHKLQEVAVKDASLLEEVKTFNLDTTPEEILKFAPPDFPNTKPKKEVSPLFKDKDKSIAQQTDFYSPIVSSIENLPIGKDGMKGSSITAFLNKRASNVNKTELYWSGLLDIIEPDKKYTKAEITDLVNEQTPKLSITKNTGREGRWKTTQRVKYLTIDPDPEKTKAEIERRVREEMELFYSNVQRPARRRVLEENIREELTKDLKVNRRKIGDINGYREFVITNKNPKGNTYDISETEWTDPAVVAHARGTYEVDDNSKNIFILEEIQSGPVQNNEIATREGYRRNNPESAKEFTFLNYYQKEVVSLVDEYVASSISNFNPRFLKYAKDKYDLDFNDVNDYETQTEFVTEATKEIIEDLAKYKKTYMDVYTDNINDVGGAYFDISQELQKKYGLKQSALERRNLPELEPIDNLLANVVYDFILIKIDLKRNKPTATSSGTRSDFTQSFKDPSYEDEFNAMVPIKLSESVKVGLLAVIKDAKRTGTNKIYVPPNKDISKAHSLGDKPTKDTYTDSLQKVLKSLNSETNGQITFKNKNPDGIEFISGETALEIDITNFNLPKNTQLRLAEGGSVSNMVRQTEMMFEEGGIADDGMTQDPVSGNEIPPGSLAEEVRDDIPAQLSEGEYVVPADVVRYYGVKFFENLRTKAKTGLQDMEEGGRIGGEPMPMNDASGISDEELQQIIQEEMSAVTQETPMMNRGGVVEKPTMYMAPGGDVSTTPAAFTPPVISSGMQSVQYINKTTNQTMYFMFIDGKINPPGTVIPPGFTRVNPMGEQAPAPEPTPTPKPPKDDGPDDPPPTTQPEGFKNWGKDGETFNPDYESWATGLIDGTSSTKKNLQKAGSLGSLVSPVLGVATGLAGKAQPLVTASEIRARAIIESARGNDTAANRLNEMADEYMGKQGKFMDTIDEVIATGIQKANAVFKRLGFDKAPETAAEKSRFKTAFEKEQGISASKPKVVDTKIEQPKKNNRDKDPFASLTAAQQNRVGSASSSTASGQASAEAKAKAAGVDVKNLKGKDDEDYNLSGSGMIAGSNVGATTGGGNYAGPMNKGGLMAKKKRQR